MDEEDLDAGMKACVLVNTNGRKADGVGDHARGLVHGMEQVGVTTTLLERANGEWWVRDGGSSDGAVTEASARSLASAADWTIVEYSPFGMGRGGFAPWLLAWVSRVARWSSIASFVHEPYLEHGSGHRILMSAWQRRQLRILLHYSRCAGAPIETWARLVGEIAPSIPVAHLPVASNLPDRRDHGEKRRSSLRAGSRLVVALFSTGHESRLDGHVVAALRALAEDHGGVLCLNLGAGARELNPVPVGVEVLSPGWLDGDVLAEHLAATDIFLSPLVDGASTRRTTIAAALQHGVAVVSTDGRLTDSELRVADAGLALAPADDPVAFAALVRRLGQNREQRLTVGRRGRAAYERRWSWSVGIPRLIALLEDGDQRPYRTVPASGGGRRPGTR